MIFRILSTEENAKSKRKQKNKEQNRNKKNKKNKKRGAFVGNFERLVFQGNKRRTIATHKHYIAIPLIRENNIIKHCIDLRINSLVVRRHYFDLRKAKLEGCARNIERRVRLIRLNS
jgi:hypothetical protein